MQREVDRHSSVSSFRPDILSRHCQELLRQTQSAADHTTLQQALSGLFAFIEQKLLFDHLCIALRDPIHNVVTVLLQAGDFKCPSEIAIREDSLGIVIEQQQAIEVEDVDADRRFQDLLEGIREGGFRSFRIVPLTTSSEPFGVLAVFRRAPGGFSQEDVGYLNNAAKLIALVMENAFMADVLGREKAEHETLVDVNTALISSLNIKKLFQEVSVAIRRIVRQDYTHLSLYDSLSDSMKFYMLDSQTHPAKLLLETLVPLRESTAGIAFSSGKPMLFRHADLQAIGSDFSRRLLELGIRAVHSFPLDSRGRKLGTLGLSSLTDDSPINDDLPLLRQIASQVAIAVDNALAYEEIARFKDKLAKEKLYLEEEIRSQHNFGEVVGNSQVLRQVLRQVEIAAPSDATVLILGETGTGKELIARALHRLSPRSEENFIKLNCAAIPTGLLESELFGHEKGAFTGAISQKVGRLELAHKGTLFLDEIGEIPMELQPKLLRVLQDQEFERLGGVKTIRVDIRLIAATNRNLAKAVDEREFRSDLYYRLNVFPIRLPPLRERLGDIPMLVRYFVQKFSRRMGKSIDSVPSDILREFELWHWPGNVRELENFIERSIILTQGNVFYAPLAELRIASPDSMKFGSSLEDVEREYILRTLRESGGVIAGARGAAERLGMKRTTLQSKILKLGITREEFEA